MNRLALELTHPVSGVRRIEFVSPRPVVLNREGGVESGDQHTGGDPELLIFDPPAVSFRLKGEARWGGVKSPQLVELNGENVERGVVKPGDRLRWWDFELTVVELQPLSDAERTMVDAARTSDDALHVYADWLESNGESKRAEWARLMLSGKADHALVTRVGASFRALVTRAPIERCLVSCGQRWESLTLGADPCVRQCGQCMRAVTWCEDAAIARGLREEPVVLDPAAPRSPGDLLRSPYVIG